MHRKINFTLIALAMLCLVTYGIAVLAKASPQLTADRHRHSFGEMAPGEKRSCVFHLTNRGTIPLEITEVRSSCTCSKPALSRSHLPAGAQAELRIEYAMPPNQNVNISDVRIRTNEPHGTVHVFQVVGLSSPLLDVSSRNLNLGCLAYDKVPKAPFELNVFCRDTSDLSCSLLDNGAGNGVKMHLVSVDGLPPRLSIGLPDRLPIGLFDATIELSLKSQAAPPLRLSLICCVTGPVTVTPLTLYSGPSADGRSRIPMRAEISPIDPTHKLTGADVKLSENLMPHLTAEIVIEGGHLALLVTPKSSKNFPAASGLTTGTVTLRTQGDTSVEVSVPIVFRN